MKITGTTNIFGIIGNPVRHSFSPIMHNAIFESMQLDYLYIPMEIPINRLEYAIRGLSALGIKGVNVTIPFKESVIPYLDNLSDSANTIGSVNTIKIDENGKLIGHNTDGEGFLKSLKENLNFHCADKIITIIGTGGSAKSVTLYCASQKARKIFIIGRNKDKADKIANRIIQFYSSTMVIAADLNDSKIGDMIISSDLLVNTTSIGLHSEDPLLIKPDWIKPELKVFDLIYNPLETKLLRLAKDKMCQSVNGLGMLVHQGAISFQIWLGILPSTEIMKNAILEHINQLNLQKGGKIKNEF